MTDDSLLKMMEASKILQPRAASPSCLTSHFRRTACSAAAWFCEHHLPKMTGDCNTGGWTKRLTGELEAALCLTVTAVCAN